VFERYAYSTSDKRMQARTARANPLSAPFCTLLYVIAELNGIATEPFFVAPLICFGCREPHVVGIAYLRTGLDETFSPWGLYYASSAGAA
jgi:hypothetical protein